MVLHEKFLQEYPVNAGVPCGSILYPTLFLLYTNDTTYYVIFDISKYADDAILYCKCEQISDLRQQPQLVSELESGERGTVDWGWMQLVQFSAGKTQLVSFDQSNTSGAIDVKMMDLLLKKNCLLRGWDSLSLLNWVGALTLTPLKAAFEKIEDLIRSMKFFSPMFAP